MVVVSKCTIHNYCEVLSSLQASRRACQNKCRPFRWLPVSWWSHLSWWREAPQSSCGIFSESAIYIQDLTLMRWSVHYSLFIIFCKNHMIDKCFTMAKNAFHFGFYWWKIVEDLEFANMAMSTASTKYMVIMKHVVYKHLTFYFLFAKRK